jgi:hypothetical protein
LWLLVVEAVVLNMVQVGEQEDLELVPNQLIKLIIQY